MDIFDSKWNNVSDVMPEIKTNVFVFTSSKSFHVAYYDDTALTTGWYTSKLSPEKYAFSGSMKLHDGDVTHWMNLSDLPPTPNNGE